MDISLASIVSTLLGGLGLFLVGMWLMTDGLKLAAGKSLRQILHRWTNTRSRGLVTGFTITALVQSSSAVTVAIIGFANAGLLALPQAVWVIFGSNAGTTVTGWLVALIGFKVNIEALALPLIGIGMLVRLTGKKSRRAAFGQALLGFGLFFLGIGILKEAFESVGAGIQLPSVADAGFASIFLYVLLGVALTTLMQSSSAAIVIILSAAQGGVIPLSAAAATVIGANLGTTSTAILSVWGATSTAKRVAASHVLFNLITAAVAIIIIVPMLSITHWLLTALDLSTTIATTLAVFHTVFNVLGILLMWPLAGRLIRFLSRQFVSEDEVAGRPKYLDKTALQVPALASVALAQEMNRLNRHAIAVAMTAINAADSHDGKVIVDQKNVEKLATAIGGYVAELSRTDLPENIAQRFPEVILLVQRYVTISGLAHEVVSLQKDIDIGDQQLSDAVAKLKSDTVSILKQATVEAPGFNPEVLSPQLKVLESDYDHLRSAVLKAGAVGSLGMVMVDHLLQEAVIVKRIARQTVKAVARHTVLIVGLGYELPTADAVRDTTRQAV